MIRLLLIFLLPFTLYASKILSYNIYDRTDRVDVMITFDTPYEGIIKQSINPSKIIIQLEDAKIESSKVKQLSSRFLNTLTITPMSTHTQIVATVPPSVVLKASKTSDSYGLRLRFTDIPSQQTKQHVSANNNPLASLPTKQEDDMSQSYYIVISILLIGIALLFFIKKKVTPKKGNQTSSWLFKETAGSDSKAAQIKSTEIKNVSIRFQKTINNDNSVVMLDFGEQSYLVLMGHSNILLDKFTDNKPITEDDFETILQNRHQELDEFLRVDNTQKEPLQSYKEKASSISYEV
ncbi:hypothetical protein KJ877_09710 [bacterium]|nr:hypothetical protein [bacterium]MBU1990041.1 hypothetical protein [bacterium]